MFNILSNIRRAEMLKFLKRYSIITIAVIVGAFFNARFLGVNHIAPGGLFGVGVVVNRLFPILKAGDVSLIGNIPLLILGWFVVGRKFVFNTIYATVLFSVSASLFDRYVAYQTHDLLLSAIIGGSAYGVCAAFIFLNNTTTGGTDIIARVIQKKFPHVKIGAMVLIVDAIVMIASMFVEGNMEIGYIAIISSVCASFVIDTIIEGLNLAKVVYIITNQYKEVAKEITQKMKRGVTAMKVRGMFKSQELHMLMCVTKVNDINELKNIVNNIDKSSFMIVTNAQEVLGNGFKKHKLNNDEV